MRKLLLFAALGWALPLAGADRPNILFIFSDDHAPNAISCYPGGLFDQVAPTPNLDRLAAQGAVFTRSYCCNSICGPSRAAILTGKHSHINGFLDNDFSRFDASQTTFPMLLQRAGYQTAIVGKWHLTGNPAGFDYWEVLPGQGSYYNPDFIQQQGGTMRRPGYVTDVITERALEWLESGRDKSKPFLLMCQHKAPHRNWSPPPRHLDLFDDVTMPEPPTLFDDHANRAGALRRQKMSIANDFYWAHDMKLKPPPRFPEYFAKGIPNGEYQRMNAAQQRAWDAAYEEENQRLIADVEAGRLKGDDVTRWKYQRYIKDYLRCIRAVDENVGKMLDYLERNGLANNTLVIYSSDQGFYLGEHGWYDKRWMFEESFMMPFIARWPGVIRPGSTCGALIQNIDYAPTFLELAGATVPPTVQGRSLVPLLKASGAEPAGWRDAVYYFYSGENTHAVAAHDGVATKRYKLMFFPKTKEWNLFDREQDPHELRSVHADPGYAEVFADMQRRYADLRAHYRMSEATLPAHRNDLDWWQQRHQQKLKEVAQGGHQLVFIGDSITHGWENTGKATWEKAYGPRKPLNLGYSGDRTEHVLWRLMNGELDGVDPKAYVLMIGTNNTGHRQDPPEQTVAGIQLILELLRDRSPDARILLLSVFPRDERPDGPLRRINDEVNRRLASLADGTHVRLLDLSGAFLAADGSLPAAVMPDFLHPTADGYRMWAEAMEPALAELLR